MAEDLFKNVGKTTASKQDTADKPVADETKTEQALAAEKLAAEQAQQERPEPEVTTDDDDKDPTAPPLPDELTLLKMRASSMGLTFSNNIGLDALKKKIETALNAAEETANLASGSEDQDYEPQQDAPPVKEEPVTEPAVSNAPKTTGKLTLRQYLIREKMKLVRVRITCLDPKKKDLPGEIITVANEYIGTVRKFVPFGEATDNGYHIPYCLYEFLKDRKFLSIRTRKGQFNTPVVESKWVKEFAIEVLEPLSPEELARLGAIQSAANNAN